ncbi:MAG: hypothetical protein V1738_04875 [Patescibacteria group bacterium]
MEKKWFTDLIDRLSVAATLGKWEPSYDRQLDFFYWKKPKMSRGVRLVKVSHETHLYLTPSGKIEGVFVEYLNGNFVEHNVEYKGMTKVFDKKVSGRVYTISRRTKKLEGLFDKFVESLRANIYRDACQDRKSIDDLNHVISQALKAI